MVTIKIDMDKRCIRCHGPGACENGLCFSCINKKLKAGDYDHILKRIRAKKGADDE